MGIGTKRKNTHISDGFSREKADIISSVINAQKIDKNEAMNKIMDSTFNKVFVLISASIIFRFPFLAISIVLSYSHVLSLKSSSAKSKTISSSGQVAV